MTIASKDTTMSGLKMVGNSLTSTLLDIKGDKIELTGTSIENLEANLKDVECNFISCAANTFEGSSFTMTDLNVVNLKDATPDTVDPLPISQLLSISH